MLNPLVSICVLSYNHENFIEYCIKSIWNQDYKNIEILALDDGSKDNSVSLLNELKNNSPFPMTVISQENSGCIGGNINKLLNLAKGKYVGIIAADDALFSDAVSKKVEIMERDDSIQYVINSKIQAIDENNNFVDTVAKMPLDDIENPTAQDVLNLDFEDIHSYYIQGSLFRKSIIDAVGKFDEDMIADDIVLRTKLSRYLINHPEYNFVTLHEPACYYRRHSSNVSDNKIRQIKSILGYLNKYWQNYPSPKTFVKLVKVAIRENSDEIKNLTKNEKRIKQILTKLEFRLFLENIFSIKNSRDKKQKIITILFMKIKINR